ncbi:MerR family transcriptional regulator [Clostridium oryzae]|uniref:HTH-type transcriptional regulator CueR n=1 Tax=Clostridium oryzae TaxID=1450648 RepID=A0A1V4IDI5_9CLOT|nr:MerR family transcriptional regulator [Clostridium oryzae]OPJ58052.1 HTH-type transcriptional regulator CueR [Clostridium oryzae]
MNISTLSNKTGASVRSLRYYEAKGLLESDRLENGYRDFDEAMVVRVKTIQMYLSVGLTTEEITDIIECPVSAKLQRPLCQKAIEIYKDKLTVVEKQISILEVLRSQLREKIDNFERNETSSL